MQGFDAQKRPGFLKFFGQVGPELNPSGALEHRSSCAKRPGFLTFLDQDGFEGDWHAAAA
jgi:hypothetical protein